MFFKFYLLMTFLVGICFVFPFYIKNFKFLLWKYGEDMGITF